MKLLVMRSSMRLWLISLALITFCRIRVANDLHALTMITLPPLSYDKNLNLRFCCCSFC